MALTKSKNADLSALPTSGTQAPHADKREILEAVMLAGTVKGAAAKLKMSHGVVYCKTGEIKRLLNARTIAHAVVRGVQSGFVDLPTNPVLPEGFLLTAPEEEIIRGVAKGYSHVAIAAELGLGAKEVDVSLANVRMRLGVESTLGLVVGALQRGLIPTQMSDNDAPDIQKPHFTPLELDFLRALMLAGTVEGASAVLQRPYQSCNLNSRKVKRILGAQSLAHAVALGVQSGVVRLPEESMFRPGAKALTVLEKEIVRGLAKGSSHEAIARMLGLNFTIFEKRLGDTRKRLGVKSTVTLVVGAMQQGEVPTQMAR